MATELTVENMFTDDWETVELVVNTGSLSLQDRKRMLEHVIAEAVSQILSAPGTTPIGLAITVNLTQNPDAPALLVSATTPKYELEPEFFV